MSFPAHINKYEAEQTVDQHCRNVAEISRNHLRRLNLIFWPFRAQKTGKTPEINRPRSPDLF